MVFRGGEAINKNWDDLRYLLALERTGSVKSAADMLKTSATTVTRKIAIISDRFKEPVFVKSNNQWLLTELGQRLFDIGVKIETSIANLGVGYIYGEHEGDVMVTSLDFINRTLLFPRLHEFHAKYPGIKLNLHSSNANLSLAYGEADVAIRLARPTSGRLHAKKLCDLKYSLFCPNEGNPDEWIGREENLDWIPEMKMARTYFEAKPILRVTDHKAALDACKKLMVAAVLPDILVNDETNVFQVPGTPSIEREAWLVTHESRLKDPKLMIVKQWIEECFVDLQFAQKLTRQIA